MGNAEPKEMHSGRESGYKGHDARTALGYNPGYQSASTDLFQRITQRN